jgi:hypothetical protein
MRDLVEHKTQLPKIANLKIRIPKSYEHPLTFDVRIGNADKATAQRALDLWNKAVQDMGHVVKRHELTEHQVKVAEEFWANFDESCMVPYHPETAHNPITVKFSYADAIEKDSELEKLDKPAPRITYDKADS